MTAIAGDKCINALFFALFWLMLCYPGGFQVAKLLLGLALGATWLLKGTIRHHFPFVVVLACVAYFLASSLVGVDLGNPGALRVLTVNGLWPIFFVALMSISITYHRLRVILRAMYWSVIYVSGCGLLLISPFAPGPIRYLYPKFGFSVIPGGGADFSFAGLHMLTFVTPALLFAAFFAQQMGLGRSDAMLVLVAGFAGTATIVLAGRRAAIISIVIGIAIGMLALWFQRLGRRRPVKRILERRAVAVALLCAALLPLLWSRIIASISDAIAFLTNSSEISDVGDQIRASQAVGLLEGFAASPFFGQGAGAVLPDIVRDRAMPWSYELTYHSILFQFGLLGMFAYFLLPAIYIVRLTSLGRRVEGVSYWASWAIVILSAGLIASYSNPYLLKLDAIWLLYLPLGVWSAEAGRMDSVAGEPGRPHWSRPAPQGSGGAEASRQRSVGYLLGRRAGRHLQPRTGQRHRAVDRFPEQMMPGFVEDPPWKVVDHQGWKRPRQ